MTGSRARRNGVAPYMASMLLVLIDAMPEAQETARLSGAAGTAAASGVLRHGMETRWPEGTAGSGRPGQRQPRWLCAEHDSPPGRRVKKNRASPANVQPFQDFIMHAATDWAL